jgi:ribosomal-protein-alanine N-acetyltransferase
VVGERSGVFCVADGATDVAIGRVSLDDQRGEWEIGYEFATSAWGRGLASEAVRAVIGWCWANLPAASLIAVTQTANERSCRLLAALGFGFELGFEEFGEQQSQFRLDAPSSPV